jgi:hypothetical protein
MRILIPRIFKAMFKTAIVYIFYVIFSAFTLPFEGFYSYQFIFSGFVTVYIAFIFIIELTRGTVFQHIFSIANALIIVLYFAYILDTGVIYFTLEQFSLMIDLRFFLAIFVLGSILGFARSMLKFLSWVNEKEEQWLNRQIKSL